MWAQKFQLKIDQKMRIGSNLIWTEYTNTKHYCGYIEAYRLTL